VIASIIVVLVGVLYYFVKEEPPLPPPLPAEVAQDTESGIMSYAGNELVEEQDGKRLWELNAETIEVDPNTKKATLKNMKGIFYRDNGGQITITAPQAFIDTQTKEILMVGEVHAVSSDGATFTAREARWFETDRHFLGTGGIKLTRDDTLITGDQIESDANMEKIKVQGHAYVQKGGTPQ
jgi:LPS export ABC transporter protein LptC